MEYHFISTKWQRFELEIICMQLSVLIFYQILHVVFPNCIFKNVNQLNIYNVLWYILLILLYTAQTNMFNE